VVQIIEDALLAVAVHHNIQAIVVRPGLTLIQNGRRQFLVRYLARAGSRKEIDKLQPENTNGPELWPDDR